MAYSDCLANLRLVAGEVNSLLRHQQPPSVRHIEDTCCVHLRRPACQAPRCNTTIHSRLHTLLKQTETKKNKMQSKMQGTAAFKTALQEISISKESEVVLRVKIFKFVIVACSVFIELVRHCSLLFFSVRHCSLLYVVMRSIFVFVVSFFLFLWTSLMWLPILYTSFIWRFISDVCQFAGVYLRISISHTDEAFLSQRRSIHAPVAPFMLIQCSTPSRLSGSLVFQFVYGSSDPVAVDLNVPSCATSVPSMYKLTIALSEKKTI